MKRIFELLKNAKKRTVVIIISSVLLLCTATTATIAYIVTKTDTQGNTFVPPVARIHIEGYDDITNVGNIPIYVRAFAVANWLSEDDEHTISSEVPKIDVDFDLYQHSEGWFLASDGFYYYTKPLAPGETVVLFTNAIQLTKKPGYELRLQLLASSIQADPIDAVNQAWPSVQVNANGELEPLSA